jgi:PcfJ-like protein
MSHYRLSEESRRPTCITPAIAEGNPWTARFIPNNNLRQHCHLLARIFRGPHPLTDPLRESCVRLLQNVEEKSCLLTAVHPSAFQAIPVLVRIASYAQRWIRAPETWSGEKSNDPRVILRSLLNHLFASWITPEFFENAWLVKGDLRYLERDWYCHLASGGSLRNVQGIPPSITSRALHLAMSAPGNLTIRQALRWGQVISLGGSAEVLAEVVSSRMVKDLSNDAVWARLFEKVVAAKDFHPQNFGLISDTLLEFIHHGKHPRAYSLVGLPLGDLLRHCRRFWKSTLRLAPNDYPGFSSSDLHCAKLRYRLHQMNTGHWARLPRCGTFESTCQIGDEIIPCRILELTQQWQLVAESQSMRHCVDTYGRSCKLGRCSIFSVRTERMVDGKLRSTSHLTIEVIRKTRTIVQVTGRRNQWINPQQIPLLRKWAEQMELRF